MTVRIRSAAVSQTSLSGYEYTKPLESFPMQTKWRSGNANVSLWRLGNLKRRNIANVLRLIPPGAGHSRAPGAIEDLRCP